MYEWADLSTNTSPTSIFLVAEKSRRDRNICKQWLHDLPILDNLIFYPARGDHEDNKLRYPTINEQPIKHNKLLGIHGQSHFLDSFIVLALGIQDPLNNNFSSEWRDWTKAKSFAEITIPLINFPIAAN